MGSPGAIADQVFGWLDQHNGAVTALATAALALLTAVLALLNRGLLRATAKATDAAVRAAKAAEDEAKASREAIELDWRPLLTFHHATERETRTNRWHLGALRGDLRAERRPGSSSQCPIH